MKLKIAQAHSFGILIPYLLTACILNACSGPTSQDKVSEFPILSNNLSNRQVKCFAEDSFGHIWIGTFRGLNRFDGDLYEQFFWSESQNSLPDNQIQNILNDSKGRLWVTTVNGVARYNERGCFDRIPIRCDNLNGLCTLEDKEGNILWTNGSVIAKYDEDSCQFEPLPIERENFYAMNFHIDASNRLWAVSWNEITSINPATGILNGRIDIPAGTYYSYMDRERYLWLSGAQLEVYDTKELKFVEMPKAIKASAELMSGQIDMIQRYDSKKIIFNTYGKGLFCYDFETQKLSHQGDVDFPFEGSEYKVSRLFSDSRNNLWIGTADQGFSIAYRYQNHFRSHIGLKKAVANKSIRALACDNERIWMSTSSEGIFVYDLTANKLSHIEDNQLLPSNNSSSRAIEVRQMIDDGKGGIWMAIHNTNEVLRCEWKDNGCKVTERHSLNYGTQSLTIGTDGTIYVGTFSKFVCAKGQNDKSFREIPVFGDYFTFCSGLTALSDGRIVAAAFMNGLKVISPDGSVSDLPVQDGDYEKCILHSAFIPTSIYADSKGNIWVGTITNGLLKYDYKLSQLSPVEGISCNDISSIIGEKNGEIWVATLNGLNCIDPSSGAISTYYEHNGTGGNQFNETAACTINRGILAFGGTHGLTLFNPHIPIHKHRAPVRFEHLHIHNQLITADSNPEIIDRAMYYNPDIHIDYWHNSFSIYFSALDYDEFEKVSYNYMLEGFDHDWVRASASREAHYANLPEGKYTFRVRISSNDSSIVEDENSIQVIVTTAPWLTVYAKIAYSLIGLILFAFCIYSIYRSRVNKLAVVAAEEEQRREKEVNKMIKRFFANISHEFRTPLTMIAGPAAQLSSDSRMPADTKPVFDIMQRNIYRMLELVNQIMDFGKLENDSLRLEVSKKDIVAVLKSRLEIFSLYIKSKDVRLETIGLDNPVEAWIDEDKIDKMFCNLVANAMKFVPNSGNLKIKFDVIDSKSAERKFEGICDSGGHYAIVSVANDGPIIPVELHDKVFERFYQIKHGGKSNYGTGIGLYYVKSLTEKHHGAIKVENLPGDSGVCFTFMIPIEANAYSEEEKVESENKILPTLHSGNISMESVNEPEEEDDGQRSRILIVDDDADILEYLSSLLSPYYKVIRHFDAKDALGDIEEDEPALVISDVLMPGMNGFEFCRKIKGNSQLCHIPVILLTAKTTVEEQVEGLDTGADAYVTKPFQPSYLLALIKSILHNREKMRDLLGSSTVVEKVEKEVELAPQDKVFMSKLYEVMENELSNPEFDIAHFTDVLHISRSKFFYKVKGLTGMSPAFFFKTYKLNRAAELIVEGKYTVSEVADLTGFSTLSHFSKSFKKHFGISPSDYHG